MSTSQRIVITGMGVCTHMGDDLSVITQDYLRVQRNKPFTIYQPAIDFGTRCHLIGEYANDNLQADIGISRKQARFMGRASMVALKATQTALAQAKVEDVRKLGIVVGNGSGDPPTHEKIANTLSKTGSARRVAPTVVPRMMSSTVSANLSNVLQNTGPSFSVNAACASSGYSILCAAQLLQSGFTEMVVTGGVEMIHVHFYAGFDSMRAYNSQDNDRPERASRPYAADRAGFIFAEGAGMMVLETEASARARGAEILGILRGYGMSSNGTGDMVAPDASGAVLAMNQALANAGISAADVDYVNTHGTSTPLGDVAEVRALREVFGERRVTYSSTKGYTGHSASATGAIEAIFTVEMMRGGWLAPCVNADPLEPEIADYPPLLEVTDRATKLALSNSFGFGGTNTCLVLEAP